MVDDAWETLDIAEKRRLITAAQMPPPPSAPASSSAAVHVEIGAIYYSASRRRTFVTIIGRGPEMPVDAFCSEMATRWAARH